MIMESFFDVMMKISYFDDLYIQGIIPNSSILFNDHGFLSIWMDDSRGFLKCMKVVKFVPSDYSLYEVLVVFRVTKIDTTEKIFLRDIVVILGYMSYFIYFESMV